MDWNLKAPSWDLAEFAQQTLPNIHGVGVANRCANPRADGEFSVDLKLGQVSNMAREPVDKWKETGASKTMSLPSASSKRPRSTNNCNLVVHCLVDGCNADLSNCREYHRRHKVCEVHSKTPEVSINGQRQRFCQQCSRFHSLEEFDEGKRSCRKRLDGHNRRRRKPQPDSMTRPGDILSHFQGTHLLTFSNSHVYPSTALGNPTWAGMINAEAEATYYNHHQQLHLSGKQNLLLGPCSIYGEGKQIKLPEGNNLVPSNQMSTEASVCEPIPRTIVSSESCGLGRSGLYERLVGESDCALSLLSSPQMQTSGITFSSMVHPNTFHDDRGVEPLDSVRVASSSGTNTDSLGMFHVHIGSDERQRNEASQVIPFQWD